MAMLKVKRKRSTEEPGKLTRFYLHGEEVPATKIARYEGRMKKQGKTVDTSDIGKPQ